MISNSRKFIDKLLQNNIFLLILKKYRKKKRVYLKTALNIKLNNRAKAYHPHLSIDT